MRGSEVEGRPRRGSPRGPVFSRPVAVAAAAAAGRPAPHGAGCAPRSLRRSWLLLLLLPSAAPCSRAPCPPARRQQRRRRLLLLPLQGPRRRLDILRRAAPERSFLPSRPLGSPGRGTRPALPAAPLSPPLGRRLTRAGTCSPRPRGIRRRSALLSRAQVAPA